MISHLLHCVAFLSTRLMPPMRARRMVGVVASALPPLSREESIQVLLRLRRGSCLTRSMTVAARLPGASVVIGIPRVRREFGAHAWVEHDGRPLRSSDARGPEIARFACFLAPG